MTSYSRKNGAIILCAAYCFIEVLLSTELIYLVPMQLLSFLKYCAAKTKSTTPKKAVLMRIMEEQI